MITQHLVDAMLAEAPIAAVVGARVYPGEAPPAPELPYIVISKVDGVGEYTLQGDAGIERARVQVDIYTVTGYAAVVALRALVREFVTRRPPPGPPCVIDSARCINDEDFPASAPIPVVDRAGPRLKRRLMEFDIFCQP